MNSQLLVGCRRHGKSVAQDLMLLSVLLSVLAGKLGFDFDTSPSGSALRLTTAPSTIGCRLWDPIYNADDFYQLLDLIGPRLNMTTTYDSHKCQVDLRIGTFQMTGIYWSPVSNPAEASRRAALLGLIAYDGKLL